MSARWRLQYSLRLLMLVVFCIVLALGWLTRDMAMRRQAISSIESGGGKIYYRFQVEDYPRSFLGTWTGLPECDEVWEIDLIDSSCAEQSLRLIRYFPEVRSVNLSGLNIVDSDLLVFEHTPKLEELRLSGTPISDSGIAHLHLATELRELNISNTNVTDGSLTLLQNHKKLTTLRTRHSNVTLVGLFRFLKESSVLLFDCDAELLMAEEEYLQKTENAGGVLSED